MNPLPRIPAIDAWLIDSTVKGYPGTAAPTRLGDIAARGWNVLRDDLPLPAAIIKASSLAHNRVWMRRYLDRVGAILCPHGKTTMSPQLFAAQLEDGAFGITCATVAQLQVYRRFGIRRVLMANQLVGARAIAYVVGELAGDPSFEIYLLVDSVAGVERLARAARAAGLSRPLRLLVEVGLTGARTGVRSMAALEELLAAIEAAAACVRVHGVECFEGVVDAGSPAGEQAVEELLSFQLEASARARKSPAAAAPWLLSAGGSAHFDLAAERLRAGAQAAGSLVVLRSGCYLTHDHVAYASAQCARATRSADVAALGEGFRPALEVWTHVQSRLFDCRQARCFFRPGPAAPRRLAASGPACRATTARRGAPRRQAERPARAPEPAPRLPARGGRLGRARHLTSLHDLRQVAAALRRRR
jgi:D-serine dehydratase